MLLLSAGMGCNDGPEPIHFQRLAIKDDVVCRDRHLKAPDSSTMMSSGKWGANGVLRMNREATVPN